MYASITYRTNVRGHLNYVVQVVNFTAGWGGALIASACCLVWLHSCLGDWNVPSFAGQDNA